MTIGLHCSPCCCWFFAALTFINVLASVAAADGDGRSHLSIKREEGESIVVKTSYGRLAGFRTFIPIGRDFDDDEFVSAQDADKNEQQSLPVNVFLGIPFAKPPVGELRFEMPVSPESWPENEVRNATDYAAMCPPLVSVLAEQMKSAAMKTDDRPRKPPAVDEDCLYLNVIAPGLPTNADTEKIGVPVAVLIHGGGFQLGSARDFDWRFLADKYVRHGILLVVIQYRLGQFGFAAATDNESFAGNYGLWDQKAALDYVQTNIAVFGGDPQRVTIWGHSAGGASVSLLSYSPQTQNLFRNVFAMSGSGFAEWAFSMSNRVENETEKMAQVVGCDSNSNLKDHALLLKACLKGKRVDELQEAIAKIVFSSRDTNLVRFSPRLDKHFFPNDLPNLLEHSQAVKKPTMIGVGDMEFLLFALFEGRGNERRPFFVPRSEYANFGRKNFERLVEYALATEQKYGAKGAARLREIVLDFYIGEETSLAAGNSSSSNLFYLNKYVELLSDIAFFVSVLIEAVTKAKAGWPVYLYMLDYVSGIPEYVPIKGSYHTVEYPHLFNITLRPEAGVLTAEDKAFQKAFVDATVQFIKSSNPSTPTVNWQPLLISQKQENSDKGELVPYLRLNARPAQSSADTLSTKFKFWQQIREEFDFDPIRGFHKSSSVFTNA